MTVFLIIIVVALFGIAAWQMSKIYRLSQPVGAASSEIATNADNRKQAYLFLGFLVVFYLFMGYCFWTYSEYYLPEPASAHGSQYDTLMFVSLGIIVFVQIVTQFLLFWFSYKYHGKKGRTALFYADNDKLEFLWTIIPVIVLSGLIIYGLFTWSEIMNVEETEDTLMVELYAKQFTWTTRYAGEDGVLGKANVRFIEGKNVLGMDLSDPYAYDDIIVSVLHLPVGRPALFKLRSQDVLHSAFMPFFRAQMNVVPGMITQFGFTPTITTEEMRNNEEVIEDVREINAIRKARSKELVAQGKMPLDSYKFDYFILCNKICGISHFNMQMKIVVESKEDFQNWLSKQKTVGEVLKPKDSKKENAAASKRAPEEKSIMITEQMSETGTEVPSITNDSIKK